MVESLVVKKKDRMRDRYGLHRGIEVEIIQKADGLLLRKVPDGLHPVDRVYGILNEKENTDDYIEKIRGR